MALDKQRILNELGNVVNQLQNADCGCMGKLFSNPGHGGGCMGSGGHGGCHGGGCMGNAGHGGCHGGGCMGNAGHGGGCMGNPGRVCLGNPLPTCGGCRRGTCPGHGYAVNPNMMGGGDPYGMRGTDNSGMGGKMGMHGGGMRMSEGGGMGMNGTGMEMNGGMGMGGRRNGLPCGRNPAKLFSETYDYLNKNLMQPVMEEVYNELKSLTPENTIGNNPLAAQMGLPMNQSGGMPGTPGMGGGSSMQPMPGMGGAPTGNPGDMSHMGAQMVNMMMSSGRNKMPKIQPGNSGQPMDVSGSQPGNTNMGMPNMNPGSVGMSSGQPGSAMSDMGQVNPAATMQSPVTQYVTTDNMNTINAQDSTKYQGNTMGSSAPTGNISATQQNMGGPNPAMQQMTNPYRQRIGNNPTMQQNLGQPNTVMQQMTKPYGPHSAAIQKYNQMFRGVVPQGLDFDPMAIALQMNPANQRQAAINQMKKMMNGNKGAFMPMLTGNNAVVSSANPGIAVPQTQMLEPGQQNMNPAGPTSVYPGTNQQQIYAATGNPGMVQQIPQQQMPQQQMPQQQMPQQQMPQQGMPQQGMPQQQIAQQQMPQLQMPQQQMPQQQIPMQQMPQLQIAQQQMQQMPQEQMQGQTPVQVDPNTGEPIMSEQQREGVDPNSQTQDAPPQEPIYPSSGGNAEAQQVYYNTLGQPVHLVPGNMYFNASPGLPQTLGGGAPRQGVYGVKNTMSKTAIAATIPIGKAASKSQLQHIYRQYKTSHSQQNLRPPTPTYANSPSLAQINIAPTKAQTALNVNGNSVAGQQMQQIPIEKVGGDTIANNQEPNRKQEYVAEAGAVPPSQYQAGDAAPVHEKVAMPTTFKVRNGLQDIAFGKQYSGRSAWSFHG